MRRQPGISDLCKQFRDEVGLRELYGRDVEFHGNAAFRILKPLCEGDRFVSDPIAERVDEAAFFRHRDEYARRYIPVAGAAPA